MIDPSVVLHLLHRVKEAIEQVPGLVNLTGDVGDLIRDLTPGDLGTLNITPCGDPDCICAPDCTDEGL